MSTNTVQEAKDSVRELFNNPEIDGPMNQMLDMMRNNVCSQEEVLPHTHLIRSIHESLSAICSLPPNVIIQLFDDNNPEDQKMFTLHTLLKGYIVGLKITS